MLQSKIKLMALPMLFATAVMATDGSVLSNSNKTEVRYIKDNKRMPDVAFQQELRSQAAWQNFMATNGTWYAVFNEENGRPHRALGKPIQVFGMDAKSQALNFISTKLTDYTIPSGELNYVSTSVSPNFNYVHFNQLHGGLKVLNSDLYVKLTPDGKVVSFGTDIYTDITIPLTASLSPAGAVSAAQTGVGDPVISTSVKPDPMILPIPAFQRNIYKLVYEVMVNTKDVNGVPSKYLTYVDANDGTVISRQNQVKHAHAEPAPPPAGKDVYVTGSVYTTNPYNPATVEPLRNLKMVSASVTYNTDSMGYIGVTSTSSASATLTLEGLWSKVYTGTTTPSMTTTINAGVNNLSFNSNSNIKERSAYYHVNIVHDYMKTKFPAFTDMDNPLETNIDLSGTCNAFYDGSSINFYAVGGGCNSLAQVGDVIYHEYGHGINDQFYQAQGAFFQNGAMGEGYADIWALGITGSPVLGIGFDDTDSAVFVRRYDIDGKVYPQDLVGEVHADGEIIAGAWWDTGLNFGNLQQMMDLYKETFYATVTGPDGTEGQVYVDVLIEALTSDDVPTNGGDNDITNGTPNDNFIVDGFAAHGITLLSNAVVVHTPIETSVGFANIPVNASVTVTYPWALSAVKMFYKINRLGSWVGTNMTNTGGANYTANIPPQPNGTVIGYYIGLGNTGSSVLTAVQPVAADLANPNIPYFILNGVDLMVEEDFDNNFGSWNTGMPGDNATTGNWTVDIPRGSFFTPGDPSSIVQTDEQHTPSGQYCAVTANAPGVGDAIGTADIDNGKTTLQSPTYNLNSFTNPIFSYWRWYINNPPSGANPSNDTWDVEITNDNVNWVKVERTNVSDKSWRRFAFRVTDYVTLSNNMKIRFVAQDSLTSALPFPDNGQSIVEAALDDLYLYEQAVGTGVDENTEVASMLVYPNPAKESIYIDYNLLQSSDVTVELMNTLGQRIYTETYGSRAEGMHREKISTEGLSQGVYILNMKTNNHVKTQKITIIK